MIVSNSFKKYDNFIDIDLINDNIRYKTQILNVLQLSSNCFYKQSYQHSRRWKFKHEHKA